MDTDQTGSNTAHRLTAHSGKVADPPRIPTQAEAETQRPSKDPRSRDLLGHYTATGSRLVELYRLHAQDETESVYVASTVIDIWELLACVRLDILYAHLNRKANRLFIHCLRITADVTLGGPMKLCSHVTLATSKY